MVTSRTSKVYYVVKFDTGYTRRCTKLEDVFQLVRNPPESYGEPTTICRFLKTTIVDKNEFRLGEVIDE